MAAKGIKVLLADDHEIFRKGMSVLLEQIFESVQVLESPDLDHALDLASNTPEIDMILIDLNMPGMSGAESLISLRETFPQPKIAVISASEDRDDILGSLQAGVHGYIPKTLPKDEMGRALREIASGHIYVPSIVAAAPSLASRSPAQRGSDSGDPTDNTLPDLGRLTPRQRDVLRELGRGQATKEIARTLGLSEGTVKVHLAAIYRILGARNRTEAVVMAGRIVH